MNTQHQQQWQSFCATHPRLKQLPPLAQQVAALHQDNCLTNLSTELALLRVDGKDAQTFLQGQLSCDLRTIDTHNSSLACYCDLKGRVVASMRLFKHEQAYYACLPQSILKPTQQLLQKYAVFSQVNLTASEQPWLLLGASGATLAETLQTLSGAELTATHAAHADENGVIIRLPGEHPRFLLCLQCNTAEKIVNKLNDNLTLIDTSCWELSNIEAGVATIYPATVGKFLPQMLNYEKLGAVSFKKGCFLGQEIVARAQHLGKLKRHLHTVQLPLAVTAKPGDALINESQQKVGTVVNAAGDLKNQQVLAVLQAGMNTNGLSIGGN